MQVWQAIRGIFFRYEVGATLDVYGGCRRVMVMTGSRYIQSIASVSHGLLRKARETPRRNGARGCVTGMASGFPLCACDPNHMQRIAVYGESDVICGKGQMVDAAWVVLASGAARVWRSTSTRPSSLSPPICACSVSGKSTSSSCQGALSMKPPVASGWQSAKEYRA